MPLAGRSPVASGTLPSIRMADGFWSDLDNTGEQMIPDAIRKRWPWMKHPFADEAYDRLQLMDRTTFSKFTAEIIRKFPKGLPKDGFHYEKGDLRRTIALATPMAESTPAILSWPPVPLPKYTQAAMSPAEHQDQARSGATKKQNRPERPIENRMTEDGGNSGAKIEPMQNHDRQGQTESDRTLYNQYPRTKTQGDVFHLPVPGPHTSVKCLSGHQTYLLCRKQEHGRFRRIFLQPFPRFLPTAPRRAQD